MYEPNLRNVTEPVFLNLWGMEESKPIGGSWRESTPFGLQGLRGDQFWPS